MKSTNQLDNSEPLRASFLKRICLLLIVVIGLIAFEGVRNNEFVTWDDVSVLVNNPEYMGLSAKHLGWMFTTSFAGHYQPLTWLSHAVEIQLWGVSAAGYHFTNLTLHLLAALIFYFIARRLILAGLNGGDQRANFSLLIPASIAGFTAALLWAVHPMRVESVAWATERRDVLSGVFLMLAVLLYLRMVQARCRGASGAGLFLAMLVVYVLSLLSKAVGMTLPVVLLMLDMYPLRRAGSNLINSRHGMTAEVQFPNGGRPRRETWARLIREKLFLLLPAIAAAMLASWAQRDAGAMRTFEEHPLSLRIAQAFYGLVFYPLKTIWPAVLVPLYEQDPEAVALETRNVLSAALVLFITLALLLVRKRTPGLLVAWCVYAVMVAPMLGLAQSGPQVVAERYSYIPTLALFVILGAFVSCLLKQEEGKPTRPLAMPAVIVLLVAVASVLVLKTRTQVTVWHDSYTLWHHTLKKVPKTPTAHVNLAGVYLNNGLYEESRYHSLKALDGLPGNRSAHITMARSAQALGNESVAEKHFLISLEIKPDDTMQMARLGAMYYAQRRFEEAERLFLRILELEPDSAVRRLDYAVFLAGSGRMDESVAVFEKTIALDPDLIDAHYRLGLVQEERSQYAEAIKRYRDGLARRPDDNRLLTRLAWVLATCPDEHFQDGPVAVDLAKRAVEDSGGRNPLALEALAAGYARGSEFDQAAAITRRLLSDESPPMSDKARERIAHALAQYEAGQAFVDQHN